MTAIPTIKVRRDGPKGYRIINASAFDPAKHEKFDAAPGPAATPAPEHDEKADLIVQLDELGIKADRRWSVERMKAAIDAALKD